MECRFAGSTTHGTAAWVLIWLVLFQHAALHRRNEVIVGDGWIMEHGVGGARRRGGQHDLL